MRAGTLHALEAYRFLSDKLRKMGRLDPAEKVKYERAAQALAEAVGKGMKESQASGELLQGPQRPEDYATDKLERYMKEGERSDLLKSLVPDLLRHREAIGNATRALEEIKSRRPSSKPQVWGGPPDVSASIAASRAAMEARSAKERLIETCRAIVAPLRIFDAAIEFTGEPSLLDHAQKGSRVSNPELGIPRETSSCMKCEL